MRPLNDRISRGEMPEWNGASNVRRKILYNARDFAVSRTCRTEIRSRGVEDCARFALRAN